MEKQTKGQELMDSMCSTYRELKSRLKLVVEENDRLVDVAKGCLVDGASDVENVDPGSVGAVDDVIRKLEERCAEQKAIAEQFRKKYNEVIFTIHKQP